MDKTYYEIWNVSRCEEFCIDILTNKARAINLARYHMERKNGKDKIEIRVYVNEYDYDLIDY